MNRDEKIKFITEFWGKFSEGDVEGANRYLDDSVTWRSMGVEGELPISGVMNKAEIGALITNVKSVIPTGLKLTALGWTIEENRVAQEVESYGVIESNGRVYNNLYHFLIEFKDGKIIKIKEYMDTIHTKNILID